MSKKIKLRIWRGDAKDGALKDVEVEANNGELKIKAVKEEGSNSFVRNVNLTFTIGREYDETSTEAVIENGLLTLTLDKKEEMKSKKIKVKF